MQKREAHDPGPAAPESGAPATPRVSGEVTTGTALAGEAPLPESRRIAPDEGEPSALSTPSDTLLSAGKPADKLEVILEDQLTVVDARLREVDARLREIDSRLAILEHKKSSSVPEPRQKPWLWIAFLIALVVVFQLLHRVR